MSYTGITNFYDDNEDLHVGHFGPKLTIKFMIIRFQRQWQVEHNVLFISEYIEWPFKSIATKLQSCE
jgi:hypothetical protein